LQVIWKETLEITDTQEIELPVCSEIMCVQSQKGAVVVYYKCDSDTHLKDTHVITLVGTGHHIPSDSGKYVGTVQLHEGALVLHVFSKFS